MSVVEIKYHPMWNLGAYMQYLFLKGNLREYHF